jgi:ABC-type arginine transport system permease subunit
MDYLPQLLIGALVTLIVAIIAIGLGSLIGLAGAAAKLSASRIARAIADV